MEKSFTNTAFAGWIRVFVSAMILQFMLEGYDLFSFDLLMLKKVVAAGVAAVLPVIYNALNPNDPRYGKSKTNEIAPKGTTEELEIFKGEIRKDIS